MFAVRLQVPVVALEAALEGLVAVNAAILWHLRERGLDLPDLYDTDVVYRREHGRVEQWQTYVDVLRAGAGDCEDLAAARAAWLRVFEAEPARAVIRRTGRRTWHAIVARADGSFEDPSRVLRSSS